MHVGYVLWTEYRVSYFLLGLCSKWHWMPFIHTALHGWYSNDNCYLQLVPYSLGMTQCHCMIRNYLANYLTLFLCCFFISAAPKSCHHTTHMMDKLGMLSTRSRWKCSFLKITLRLPLQLGIILVISTPLNICICNTRMLYRTTNSMMKYFLLDFRLHLM